MIVPASYDFTIYRDVDFSTLQMQFTDADEVGIDLSGYSVFCEARRTPIAGLEFDLEPVFSNAATGTIVFNLTRAKLAALPLGDWHYDIMLENGSGVRSGPYVTGRVLVQRRYTHIGT